MRGNIAFRLAACQLCMVLACLVMDNGHAALDPPHTGTVGCLSCHQMTSTHPKLLPPLGLSPQNNDETVANVTCTQCHCTDPDVPCVATHSSLQADNGYGDWSVECWVCHNQHLQEQNRYHDSTYGKFIRRTVNLANISGLTRTGSRTVKFLGATGPNSFADGDPAAIDGICEVCHTQTTHFRNDGLGQDQLHSNIDGGQAGANCSTCHNHSNGFAHGRPGTGCGDCHGNDPKHLLHLALTGNCSSCHNVNYFPAFTSGTDANGDSYYNLAETNVCNGCHKNGVGGDPAVAPSEYKPGWKNDLFDIDCGGCHGYAPDYANGSPKFNSHQRHDTYGFSCSECHYNTTANGTSITDTALHINDLYDVTFQDVNISYNSTGHTCANTLCHNNGTTVATWESPVNNSPSWGGSFPMKKAGCTDGQSCGTCHNPPLASFYRCQMCHTNGIPSAIVNSFPAPGPHNCTGCHSFPPAYALDEPKANSHLLYGDHLLQSKPCNMCHYGVVAPITIRDGLRTYNITDIAKHDDGVYDVAPDTTIDNNNDGISDYGFDYTFFRGGGTCSSNKCHAGTWLWGNSRFSVSIDFDTPSAQELNSSCGVIYLTGSVSPLEGNNNYPNTFNWSFSATPYRISPPGYTDVGETSTKTLIFLSPISFKPTLSGYDAKNHTFGPFTKPFNIAAEALNLPPEVARSGFRIEEKTVTFTDYSYDLDFDICRKTGYSGHDGSAGWAKVDWGDGTIETLSLQMTASESGSGIEFSHTYAASGNYTISYSVRDNARNLYHSMAPETVIVP